MSSTSPVLKTGVVFTLTLFCLATVRVRADDESSTLADSSAPADCSNAAACNSNAWDAYDASEYNSSLPTGSCVCVCNYGYSGDSCDSCDSYAAYTGYPYCVFNHSTCTVGDYCAGGGNSVSAELWRGNGGCKCTCARGFAGARCDRCDNKYEGYPTCTKKPNECFVEDDCTGSVQAFRVDGNKASGCDCKCRYNYAGSTCNQCATPYYINYPNCTYNTSTCTVENWCNGNAEWSRVEYGSCGCRCKTGFIGVRCEHCRTGYVNYPLCTPCASSTHTQSSTSSGSAEKTSTTTTSSSTSSSSFENNNNNNLSSLNDGESIAFDGSLNNSSSGAETRLQSGAVYLLAISFLIAKLII